MSDALGQFLNELIVCRGKTGVRISIICDNAKRVQDADFVSTERRRRAPRRSVSTPLNHMSSRWESSFGLTGEKSLQQSTGTRPSRWESDSLASSRPIELKRPKRDYFSDSSRRHPDQDTKRQLKSLNGAKNMKREMTTSSLPKSLRSLPYWSAGTMGCQKIVFLMISYCGNRSKIMVLPTPTSAYFLRWLANVIKTNKLTIKMLSNPNIFT